MSDPDNTSERAEAEFSPEQLDHLEDALERWTSDATEDGSPVLEDSLLAPNHLAPNIRARLEDYRALLAMTRDELPMEDVPDALLAGVLAEAHASVSPQTRPVTRRELVPAGPSLWERLRRSMLLPGFALAGSAALLLWVVQPSDEPGLDGAVAERSEGAPARLSQGTSPAPAAAEAPELAAPIREQREQEAASVADKDAEEAKSTAPGATPPAAAAADPAAADALGGAGPKDMPKADRTKKASKKLEEPMPASYPGLDGEPMAEGVDKEALRDTLDKADAARRKGGCTEAMSQYIEAMNMSGANSERAKARAGYGLCLSAQGDEDGADKYFDAARELSPAIDGWIKRERGDGPARKAPAKPSAKAKMDAPSDL